MSNNRSNAINWISGVDRLMVPLMIVLIPAFWFYTRTDVGDSPGEPPHAPGAHGGTIVSLAGDRFHAEAIIEQGGTLRLFMLGRDETRILDVPVQPLTAFIIGDGYDALPIPLTAARQPGDAEDRTSQFVGQLPPELQQRFLRVMIPNVHIGRERLRIAFSWSAGTHDDFMPAKLTNEAERELYLVAAGKYTAGDIAANGSVLPSQKFHGFRARHDFNPQPGDRLCPISRTKANPQCTWIVEGQRYEFCCPPCIDEFVAMAKEQPEKIERAEDYVAESTTSGGFCTGVSTTVAAESKSN